ncbi:MAG: helix-turn-helix transcriptional regulator [Clostridia bacterium]|nr:helix-turn-helix transcriptional regulator [Clostridia bacterium]
MKDVKPTISKNLAFFRRQMGLTQAQLAEKLNYSDKAISRWEHGDTLPDINVMCQLCDFYGIDMNTLVSEDAELAPQPHTVGKPFIYKLCIMLLTVSVIWLLAVVAFTYYGMIGGSYEWLLFIWALPVTALSVGWYAKRIFHPFVRFITNTFLNWTLILAVFLTFMRGGYNVWSLFLVGIPIQAIIILRFTLKFYKGE